MDYMKRNKCFGMNMDKKNWWILVVIIHWLTSFVTDKFIFIITNENKVFYLGMKIVFLICMFCVWRAVYILLNGIMQKNAVVIHRLIYSLAYGMILAFFLILIWPGIWRTDEFGVLGNVIALQIYWWQHFLTSFFYIVSLMLLPIPTGVIIVQVLLACSGFGYLAQKLEEKLQMRWGGIFLLVPFCVPSVLMFHLYPMRITLYAILELVVLCFLYDHIERKKHFSEKEAVLLAIGTAVLANWRSESIYYAVLMPLFLGIALYKTMMNRRQYFYYIAVTVVLTTGIYAIQSHGIHKERNDAYEMTAYAQSLLPLVRTAYLDGDEQGLQIVDKVIDVNAVLQAAEAGKEGIDSFWEGDMSSREYSSEQFLGFKKQYYTWVLRYWKVFLGERTYNFLTSYEQTQSTSDLYDESKIQFVYFLQTFPLTKPVFPAVRKKIIQIMEMRIWCIFEIPILVLAASALHGVRKKKKAALLPVFILVRIPLIFLTAPDNFFMYYYPVFLAGSVVLILGALCFWQNRRNTKK